jgi:hypothetical protein
MGSLQIDIFCEVQGRFLRLVSRLRGDNCAPIKHLWLRWQSLLAEKFGDGASRPTLSASAIVLTVLPFSLSGVREKGKIKT